MPFKDRTGPDPSKRLYAEAKVKLKHRKEETTDLINQLNGQLEVMSNNDKNIARNQLHALNDFISAGKKDLDDKAKLRSTILDTLQKDVMPAIRTQMVENIAKETLKARQKQSNVQVVPQTKSNTPAPHQDNSSQDDNTWMPSGQEVAQGTFVGGNIVSDLTPNFLSTGQGISHQADVAEAKTLTQISALSDLMDDKVAATQIEQQAKGIHAFKDRVINRDNIYEAVSNLDATIQQGLVEDDRIVTVQLSDGEWTGAINSLTIEHSPELREAIVGFLRAEVMADIAIGNGLSATEIVEKYLPTALKREAELNSEYKTNYVINKVQNNEIAAVSRLTDALNTNNENILPFAQNLFQQISTGQTRLQALGITTNSGKSTLDIFDTKIKDVIETLVNSGREAEARKLAATIPLIENKFPHIGPKNGKKFGFNSETGGSHIGKVDPRFSEATMAGNVDDAVAKREEKLRRIEVGEMRSTLRAYEKAVLEGDRGTQLEMSRKFTDNKWHIDPVGQGLWSKFYDPKTSDLPTGNRAFQILDTAYKDNHGVILHSVAKSVSPEAWATWQQKMKDEGKEIDLRIYPFGLHPELNKEAIKDARLKIKGWTGSIDGKSSTFLTADQVLGNHEVQKDIFDKELPLWIAQVREAQKTGAGKPGFVLLGEDEIVGEAVKAMLADLSQRNVNWKELKRKNPNLPAPPYVFHRAVGKHGGWTAHTASGSEYTKYNQGLSQAQEIINTTNLSAKGSAGTGAYLNVTLPENGRENLFKPNLLKSTDVQGMVTEHPYLNNLWYQLAAQTNGEYTALDLAQAAALKYDIPLEIEPGVLQDAEIIAARLKNRVDPRTGASDPIILQIPGTRESDGQILDTTGYVTDRAQLQTWLGSTDTLPSSFFGTGESRAVRGMINQSRTNEPVFRRIVDLNNEAEARKETQAQKCTTVQSQVQAEQLGITKSGTHYGFGSPPGYGITGQRDQNNWPIAFNNHDTAVSFTTMSNAYSSMNNGSKLDKLVISSKREGKDDPGNRITIAPELATWISTNDPTGALFGWTLQADGSYMYDPRVHAGNAYHDCRRGI